MSIKWEAYQCWPTYQKISLKAHGSQWGTAKGLTECPQFVWEDLLAGFVQESLMINIQITNGKEANDGIRLTGGVEMIYNQINHYSVGGIKKDLNLATKALGKRCANSKTCKQ